MAELVTPYAVMYDVKTREDGIALLRKIERMGRISHRSEDAQTDVSYDRFLRTVVLGHGDWSIVEHASVTVEALVDRGIQQEWTRHRLFAYTVESTRFVNYLKKVGLRFIRLLGLSETQDEIWCRSVEHSARAYTLLLESGLSPQMARSVLPLSLASQMAVTGNLRNWRHLFLMRTTKETHPQFREVIIPLLAEFQEKIPILFEDIVPMSSQREAMRKTR